MPHKPSAIVGLHLDLKGMLFKPGYFPQLMADLVSQGVNTLLVEYEDAFPFRGRGLDIAHDPASAWSRATLKRFLSLAADHKIEIIPLQQCLGHLEYILGWDRFRPLSENRLYPSTIRVDDPESVGLVHTMLREMLEAHPDSRYFHLGMDEAWALADAAKRLKRDVLDLYLDHLRGLLPIVEGFGKKPIIWTDMLEDHFRPDAFAEFKDRVIFGTWDYGTIPAQGGWPNARLSGGTRVSRAWLENPADTRGPAIGAGTKFVEDLPANIRKVVERYRDKADKRMFLPLFQADMWRGLGAQVLPVSTVRISSHLSVLPAYHEFAANISGMSRAVKRAGCMGHIATSWARGTSWCPPNFPIDLTWPLVGVLSRSMGRKPRPFFAGLPDRTVERLMLTLGRSRRDWRLEGRVAQEMEALLPKVKGHRFEWRSIILMARALELQRRAEFNLAEVDYFFPNHRPCDTEWQRRLDEQAATLKAIAGLRGEIVAHFGKRYHGKAFEEWVGQLFGVLEQRIKDVRKICRAKKALARKTYARKR